MATLTNYHWSSLFDCVMHETDQSGDTHAIYTREPELYGPLLSENRNATEYYHHYDALGSTTFLTDETATVTDTFLYDAWGNSVTETGVTPTPYRWGGRWGYQHDQATGQMYVRARSYAPTVARWASVDPLHLISLMKSPVSFFFAESDNSDNALTVPSYLYTMNEPILRVDPTGLVSISVKEPVSISPCGGWRAFVTYQAQIPNKFIGEPIVAVQKICILSGAVTDCDESQACQCQKQLPAKDCTGCCYLEIIEPLNIVGQSASVEDENTIPKYAPPGCTSAGNWSVYATVKFFVNQPVLRGDLFELRKNAGKKETCDAGCKTVSGITLGPHIVLQDGEAPSWWYAYSAFDEVSVATKCTWSCCGIAVSNWQRVLLPNGKLAVWPD